MLRLTFHTGWVKSRIFSSGNVVTGENQLTTQALLDGASKGRDSKGIVYVYPSGNGGRNQVKEKEKL